jgi:hypothetical protein
VAGRFSVELNLLMPLDLTDMVSLPYGPGLPICRGGRDVSATI